MNNLLLTGIATELDVQSGSTSYSLVFNGGELHLPVGEEAVSTALSALVREMPADREEYSEASEHVDDDRVAPYQEISNGPSEGEIAAVVANHGWESSNGQLPVETTEEGAEIYSATDDYAEPPDYTEAVQANHIPTFTAPEIDDGVNQL